MPQFQYECANQQGDTVKGSMTAQTSAEVVQRLRSNGLVALEIEEIVEKKSKPLFSSGRRVKPAELSLFSRQFAAMLGAGIPVTRTIATLSQQQSNSTMAEALANIAQSVEGGSTLGDAFAKYPNIFPPLYLAMIRAGEMGGILEETLLRLSVQLQKDKQLKDNITAATTYPKLVGCFAVVLFIAMLIFLVPTFQGFISDTTEIPGLTKFIFAVSESLRTDYIIWIGTVAAIITGIVLFVKSALGHNLAEHMKLKVPIFGPIILRSVIARFCRTLATLLEGGIPVVQALKTSGPTSGSDVVAAAVERAAKEIEEGKTIAAPLEQSGIFPPMVTQMISIGENSGTLPELLDKVAEFYEDDVSSMSKSLSAILEPVMLIVVGGVVGMMLISLYLPIFSSVVSG